MRSGTSLPSAVSGTSSLSYLQLGHSFLYWDSNVLPTSARIWKAEMLTYTTFALPLLSATTLAASDSPIGAFCSGVLVLNMTPPSPIWAGVQQVANSTPALSASLIGAPREFTSAAGSQIASAPLRVADRIALPSFSGVPSVAITVTVQPSSLAPSLRTSANSRQVEGPQPMKKIFLPLGIGLPTGSVLGIDVGCFSLSATSLLASLVLADDEPPPELEPESPLLSPPPHPAAITSTAARAIRSPNLRRRRGGAPSVMYDMILSSSSGDWWVKLSG